MTGAGEMHLRAGADGGTEEWNYCQDHREGERNYVGIVNRWHGERARLLRAEQDAAIIALLAWAAQSMRQAGSRDGGSA